MSNSQEPSYYEIALTNRQVLGFFVVLLLCVVGAFFSGIWLGKKQSGSFATLAQAETTVKATTDEEEPLEELNFFTDQQAEPAPEQSRKSGRAEAPAERQDVASNGNAGTTLREDVEAAVPTRQAEAAPPPSEPAAAVKTSQVAAGGFVIQVFSSPDGDQARRLMDRLVNGGYQAFLLPEEVGGRTMHRVRIGPFSDKDEADRLAPGVAKAFQVDTWVTRNE